MARKLTERQAAFCRYLVTGMSATQAAREAGYSESYANRQAKQLLDNPQVSAYLTALREEAASEAVMTLRELQEWWTSIVRTGETRDALKASEYLGKSHGGFTDKQEHTGDIAIRIIRD